MKFRWKDTEIVLFKSGKVGFVLKYPKLVGVKDVSFKTQDNQVLIKADFGDIAKDALDVVTSKVKESVVPILDFLSSSYKTFLSKKVEHKPVVKTDDVSVSVSGDDVNVSVNLPESWKEESEIVHIFAVNGVLACQVDVLKVFHDFVESTKTKWDDYLFGVFKYGYLLVAKRFGEDDSVYLDSEQKQLENVPSGETSDETKS